MDVNTNNAGECKLCSAYLVYDRVDGFCENSRGRLFFGEKKDEHFNQLSYYQKQERLYDMGLCTVFKSDSFHILLVC
jgi:hypothetical protein